MNFYTKNHCKHNDNRCRHNSPYHAAEYLSEGNGKIRYGRCLEFFKYLPNYYILIIFFPLRIFKFNEPFTDFKQAEFTKTHLTDNEANKLIIRGSTGYIANDFRGLSVLNMGLPLYPLEVSNIKTNGKAIDIVIDRNYLYVACGKYIEVYDIKEAEKPIKIFEHLDKDKEFKSLKVHDSKLYALYADGSKNYGFVVFQVE